MPKVRDYTLHDGFSNLCILLYLDKDLNVGYLGGPIYAKHSLIHPHLEGLEYIDAWNLRIVHTFCKVLLLAKYLIVVDTSS